MVGPVLNTGPTGSSRYALPNYAPITQGMALFGQGIGKGFESLFDRQRADEEKRKEAEAFRGLSLDDPQAFRASLADLSPKARQQALTMYSLFKPQAKGRWEPVIQNGAIVGQRHSVTGEMKAHPQTPKPTTPTASERNYQLWKKENPNGNYTDFLKIRSPGIRIDTSEKIAVEMRAAGFSEPEIKAALRKKYLGTPTESTTKLANVTARSNKMLDTLTQPGDDGRPLFYALANLGEAAADKYVPFGLGNYALSEDYQKAKNAGYALLESNLRLASGAATPEEEVGRYAVMFLPQPGDKDATIKQKFALLSLAGNVAAYIADVMPDASPEERLAEFNRRLSSAEVAAPPTGRKGTVERAAEWIFGDDDTPTGDVIPAGKVQPAGMFRPGANLPDLKPDPAPEGEGQGPIFDEKLMGGVGTVSGLAPGAPASPAPPAPAAVGFDPAMATPSRFSTMTLDQLKAIPAAEIATMGPAELDALEAAYAALAGTDG